MKGIPFVFPLFDSADFFSAPAESIENCFQLFEVYVRESPADKGVLLAFRTDMEEHLVGLLYGQRALCIGALAPLNYVGTSEHSYAKLTPFKRLAHTGKAFEKIYFGSRVEADGVLKYVHRLHEQVKGTLKETAGPTPAGKLAGR